MKSGKKYLIALVFFAFSMFFMGSIFATSNIIKIEKVVLSEKTNTADASVQEYTDNYSTTDVVFHSPDDYVTYEVTIRNTDDKNYVIKSIADNDSNEYVSYDYEGYEDLELKANGTASFLVKIKYANKLDDFNNRNFQDSIVLTLELEDVSSVSHDRTTIIVGDKVNPSTFDYVYTYFVMLIVSFAGLITLFMFKKSSKKTKMIVSALVAFMILPISAFALNKNIEKNYISLINNVYIRDQIKVVYVYDNDSEEKIVDYNSFAEPISVPNKDGYNFDGWFKGEDKFDFATRVIDDIELTAKYSDENESYSIFFDVPEREGYLFTGWTDEEGNASLFGLFNTSSLMTENFMVVPYSISYEGLTEDEISSLDNPDSYTVEDEITLNNPTREGYDFVGWGSDEYTISSNVDIDEMSGDLIFTAFWVQAIPDTYTIIYDLNGGVLDSANPNYYSSDTDTFTLVNPTKEGYDFVGWKIGDSIFDSYTIFQGSSGNLNLEAVFELKKYDIVYELDGGDSTNPISYTSADEITLSNPSKNGYKFIGWVGTDVDELTMDVTIPSDSIGTRSYVAYYEKEEYSISYELSGGVAENPSSYTIEDEITLNNPTKVGNTFAGWKLNDEGELLETVTLSGEVGDKVYVAYFTPNPYTIVFDKNSDAIGSMDDEIISFGETKSLSKNLFSKSGYKFVGWSTNPDGTGTLYADEEIVENLLDAGSITLYANWRKMITATFAAGPNVNAKMKQLSGQSVANKGTYNYSILKVKYSDDVPLEYQTTDNIVSDSKSQVPIYMWFIDGVIYYGSSADQLYLGKDGSYLFNALFSVTEIDNNFSTENCTSMTQMYWGAHELVKNDVSHFQTSNVTNMASMFGENMKMESYDIKDWDVRKVTTFKHMFNQNYAVTVMDVSGWHTDSAQNMSNMFCNMRNTYLYKLDNFNTSKVTNMHAMFNDNPTITTLDLSNFDTSKVTDFSGMFKNDTALVNVNLSSFVINTSKNVVMNEMFQNVSSMTTLDLSNFDTSRVTNFTSMFNSMASITTIYVSDSFVTTAATSNPVMFKEDSNLVGGNGTLWTSSKTKLDYAKIDDVDSAGYFTRK